MSSIPPTNHWDDWSWAESDSEEEIIEETIQQTVAEIAKNALSLQSQQG